MTLPSGIYPLTTKEGTPIPLDIIEFAGIIKVDFTTGAFSSLTIAEGNEIVSLFSSQACLISALESDNPTSLSNNTVYDNTGLIPGNTVMTVKLPAGSYEVIAVNTAGTLYVQLMTKWVALALDRQFTKK